MSKFVALAINTTSAATTTPGGPFASATVPRSQFAIRTDINDLKTNSVPEFVIEGLVASNVGDVKIDCADDVLMVHSDGASAGYTGTLESGYDLNTSNSGGIGAFKLSGNINAATVDFTADRAGTYNATIFILATAL